MKSDPPPPEARRPGVSRGLLGMATEALNALGSIWIFALMVTMLADMSSRSLLNRPISGVAEVAGLSVVGIVYLQLAAAVRCGRMTRADFIAQWVQRRLPGLGRLMSLVFNLLGAATMAGLAYASLPPFLAAWTDNEPLGTAGVFLVQTWPFRGIVVLGAGLAAVCYLTLAAEAAVEAASPRTRP